MQSDADYDILSSAHPVPFDELFSTRKAQVTNPVLVVPVQGIGDGFDFLADFERIQTAFHDQAAPGCLPEIPPARFRRGRCSRRLGTAADTCNARSSSCEFPPVAQHTFSTPSRSNRSVLGVAFGEEVGAAGAAPGAPDPDAVPGEIKQVAHSLLDPFSSMVEVSRCASDKFKRSSRRARNPYPPDQPPTGAADPYSQSLLSALTPEIREVKPESLPILPRCGSCTLLYPTSVQTSPVCDSFAMRAPLLFPHSSVYSKPRATGSRTSMPGPTRSARAVSGLGSFPSFVDGDPGRRIWMAMNSGKGASVGHGMSPNRGA